MYTHKYMLGMSLMIFVGEVGFFLLYSCVTVIVVSLGGKKLLTQIFILLTGIDRQNVWP